MARSSYKELKDQVKILNKKFKKTNRTAVKFDIYSAYGGHQIVVKDNKTGGVKQITYGFDRPQKVLDNLERKDFKSLRYEMNRFHNYVMSFRKKKKNVG